MHAFIVCLFPWLALVVCRSRSSSPRCGLPHSLAGVTLLSLFVTTVVAGVVALAAGVGMRRFVRDLCFLFFALCNLVRVLVSGTVNVWCCAEPGKLSHPDLAASLLLEDDDDVPPLPSYSSKIAQLRMPLYLQRRLTIPDIAAHRWSRPCAVAFAALAPVLLATAWTSHNPAKSSSHHAATTTATAARSSSSTASLASSSRPSPRPQRTPRPLLTGARVPWLAVEFLMSVLWGSGHTPWRANYMLGVTVLACGDSLGDLVSNVAMATHRGPDGAQMAVSSCCAGPPFNTVVGLRISLTLAAGAQYLASFMLPADEAVYETVGFLCTGPAWVLVVVPVRGMRLDRVHGVGLIIIYLTFFGVRVLDSLGLWFE
ncbi:hypothetical protein VPH35_008825 [Triticum aestivum]